MAWVFTVAWGFAVQSTKTLPLNATSLFLLSAETVCPCWPLGVPSGWSYTPVGLEPSRCCGSTKQRVGAALVSIDALCFRRQPGSAGKLTLGFYGRRYPVLTSWTYFLLTSSSFLNLAWLPESDTSLLPLAFYSVLELIPGGCIPHPTRKGRQQAK